MPEPLSEKQQKKKRLYRWFILSCIVAGPAIYWFISEQYIGKNVWYNVAIGTQLALGFFAAIFFYNKYTKLE
jgi:membrane protein YdbS with pleckstrin-like domain